MTDKIPPEENFKFDYAQRAEETKNSRAQSADRTAYTDYPYPIPEIIDICSNHFNLNAAIKIEKLLFPKPPTPTQEQTAEEVLAKYPDTKVSHRISAMHEYSDQQCRPLVEALQKIYDLTHKVDVADTELNEEKCIVAYQIINSMQDILCEFDCLTETK